MNAIVKTIWLIESSLDPDSSIDREVTLEEIAAYAGMSRFHLTRIFGQSLGRSVMSYMRGRRLSEAGRQLANGAPDILAVALDAGYGSHEAFTRAFRDEFGVSPAEFRERPDQTRLMEPIRMDTFPSITLSGPRMVEAGPMLFVGMGRRYRYDQMASASRQWDRFRPWKTRVPHALPGTAWGICTNHDPESMDYISAVEVSAFGLVAHDLQRLRVPAQRFAVFSHKGHISEIQAVFRTIFSEWLPNSGLEEADAPSLERYGPEFDPASGEGGYEIWAPVKN